MVAPNATIVYNNVTYTVNDVFGVWLLSNDDDLVATAGSAPPNWGFNDNNAGTGGIVGYNTNPPNGIVVPPGGSAQFSLSSLSGTVEQVGYHIRVNEPAPFWGGGNTGFGTVPEPGTIVALVCGAGLLAARRRKR